MSGLAGALRAIVARINGVFDDPDLEAFGPLGDTAGDVAAIAEAALAAHDAAVSAGGWYQGGDRTCGPNATTFRFIRDESGIVAYMDGGTRAEAEARGARIVACVNACAGIADPARLVAAVGNALAALRSQGVEPGTVEAAIDELDAATSGVES